MATPTPPRFATSGSSKGPRSMEVLDEAVSLIRQTPLSVLSIYYLGAFPFCLGLIYFWFDMTQGADAEAHLAPEALALTALYFWLKTCQAVFARKLLAMLEGEDTEAWTAQRWANTALLQAIFAGSFLLIYPVSIIVTLPFGWVSAFYHNISIVGTSAKGTVRTNYKEASELARLWPKQNHLIIAILLVAALVLFLNLAVFCIVLPQLLNMLFGIETVFDENTFAWNNSSFYLDVSVFCFLILNPLNKAVYALRCFYGRARFNGADLKSALRRLQTTRTSQVPVRALALILMLSVFSCGGRAQADPAPTSDTPAKISLSPDPSAARLDQAIQKTLEKDEFAWRLPRTAPAEKDESWLERTLNHVLKFFQNLLKKPVDWLGKFFKWLFDSDKKHDETTGSWLLAFSQIPWGMIFLVFAMLVVLVLLYWLFIHLRRKPAAKPAPLVAAVRTVDLEAEDVRADDLPEDSWLALAQQMIDRGELRLALRAFYLATLSVLAQQQLVRLGAAKSNRDYLTELTRRLRGNTSVLNFFRENVHLFEASWYGTHAVTIAIIDTMRANHQQMRGHAAS